MPVLRVPIGPDGPVIDLGLWTGRVAAQALIARGRAVPGPQAVRALIDTGADRTAIHPAALQSVQSLPAGTARVRRPGTGTAFRRVDIHDVRLAFAGISASSTATWVDIDAVGVVPANPSILALIGRDMLEHCQFIYDGWGSELLLIH